MGQALHMSNERSCTCQIYIAGSRQTTVSDSVPRSLALHVSVMLGALAFICIYHVPMPQAFNGKHLQLFLCSHDWWTQVQVPSSPTSVSSSNEVRKFSLLNLELSLERATATDTVEASSPGSNSAGTFNQDLFGIEIQRTGRFCRLDGEAEEDL